MSQRVDISSADALGRDGEPRGAAVSAPRPTPASGAGARSSAQTGPTQRPDTATSGADVAGEVRATASHLASRATAVVGDRLSAHKGRLAAGVGSVAAALRESGERLVANDGGVDVRPMLGAAADRVEQLSSYLDERELGELVDDVEALARRRPAIFFAGAFALGFLAARFVRSSDAYARRGTRRGTGRMVEGV